MLATLDISELEGINFKDIPTKTLFRPFTNSETIYFRTDAGAICIYRSDEEESMLGYTATNEQMEAACRNCCRVCPPNEKVTLSNSSVGG